VRHIVLPVTRRIPDEQIALYVEEHDDNFEGALITAAEFARKTGLSPLQARMIRAVVHVADVRAERSRLSSVVSLDRLRKYGIAALISFGVYIVMCAAFPQTIGRHIVRALQPWRVDQQGLLGPDGRPLGPDAAGRLARRVLPIEFRLSAGDVRLARGEDFRLEVQLSREPQKGKDVLLNFRSVADAEAPGEWQQLPMGQIEKLRGYARRLESVSEDMEFRVRAEGYVSQTHRITVYDRIELQGVEITTRFPAYLEFPDRAETLSNGDVSAPIGSTVTVRVLVNTELASGKLIWEDGTAQPLAVDSARTSSALASFEVVTNRQYNFEVTDIDGQVAKSLGLSEVYALKDNPPAIELLQPTGDLETHPFGEVTFRGRVTDDFGTERVDLVYLRFSMSGESQSRVPLALERPGEGDIPLPEVIDATLRLLLEEAQPPLKSGEVLSWYLEARDRKPDNLPAMSDLHMIVILHFELWGAYGFEAGQAPGPVMSGELPISLGELLQAVWELHRQKGGLKQEEYNRKCEAVADMMAKPDTGEVYDFGAAALPKQPSPRQVAAAKRAQKHAEAAYEALLNHNTSLAARHLRLAIADLIAAGISDTEALMKEGPAPDGGAGATGGGAAKQQESRLLEVFAEIKAQLEDQTGSKIENSLNQAEAAAKARGAVQQVRKQQQGIIDQAKELARSADGGAAQGGKLQGLGKDEQSLAQKTRATGNELKRGPAASGKLQKTGEKLQSASSAMQAAAGHLGQGEVAKAVTQA
ncbi:MAG: hypothetical protein WBF17_12925, partial [Phycisphaerae bacterium]